MSSKRERRGGISRLCASVLVLVVAVLSTLSCVNVLADTPASCMRDQIMGPWIFSLGRADHDKTLNCSVSFPVVDTYHVELSFPDVAVDQYGRRGFWTMIYNQGFEIQIGGRKFFAFSYYEESGKAVTSFCGRTFPGWFHADDPDSPTWGCYTGKRNLPSEVSTAPKKMYNRVSKSSPRAQLPFQRDDEYVQRINRAQTLWRASHPVHYEGRSLGDIERHAGVPKSRWDSSLPQARYVADRSRLSRFPSSFDWGNVSGINYLSPVRSQGMCGSCYAFGSAGMMEARFRIASKLKLTPIFSPQEIVSCSNYSQGCNGGFPYLIAGKYGEDFGLVEESCFPYQARDSQCVYSCTHPKRWRTTGYYYVGGFFGACNEEKMIEELINHGPMAVSFEVYPDFHNYAGGIYKKTDLLGINPFEVTNHVVVIVGYGVENNVPYWRVKNSWGSDWGENGYFRIIRGQPGNCAIETMAVGVSPVLA